MSQLEKSNGIGTIDEGIVDASEITGEEIRTGLEFIGTICDYLLDSREDPITVKYERDNGNVIFTVFPPPGNQGIPLQGLLIGRQGVNVRAMIALVASAMHVSSRYIDIRIDQ